MKPLLLLLLLSTSACTTVTIRLKPLEPKKGQCYDISKSLQLEVLDVKLPQVTYKLVSADSQETVPMNDTWENLEDSLTSPEACLHKFYTND